MASGLVILTGCGESSKGPRELTTEESERLAVARFNNYDRHYAPFTLQTTVQDQQLFIKGRVDFQDHLAYGSITTSDQPPSYGLIMWNFTKKALLQSDGAELPQEPPADKAWEVQPMETRAPFDIALSLLPTLAADRPENPLLLRQNGAQWIGSETVDGVTVDLLTGPGADNKPSDRVTYYVTPEGKLLRVLAKLASSADPTVIDILPGEAAELTPIAQLR